MLLACLAVLVPVITVAATPPAADRAFAQALFSPIAGALSKSAVPVLLPGALPAADLKGLLAEVAAAGAQGYTVDLDYARDCHEATACYAGQIRGARSDGSKLKGEPVALSNGATGYFVLGPCAASCSDSTLTFDSAGNRYVFAAKGAAKPYLVQWAASIVPLSHFTSH